MPPENTTPVGGFLPRAFEAAPPKIRHEFAAEKLRSQKSVTQSRDYLNFIGSSISLPDSWNRASAQGGGRAQITVFTSPDGTAQMFLFDRGIPVKKESATALKKLLSDNANLTRARELAPREIRKLSDVLGVTTIGDNQFVNPLKQPGPKAAVFHIFTAQLIPVNGKPVLEVQGNFFDDTGKKNKEYRGIFVSSGVDGATIKEFFVQAKNIVNLARHSREYRRALQSIKW